MSIGPSQPKRTNGGMDPFRLWDRSHYITEIKWRGWLQQFLCLFTRLICGELNQYIASVRFSLLTIPEATPCDPSWLYRTQLNAVRRTCRCENPVQSFKLNLITQRGTGTVRFDQCDISRYDFCGGKRRIDRFYLSFYAGATNPSRRPPSLFTAPPLITAYTLSWSRSASSRRFSTTTPAPLLYTVPVASALNGAQCPSCDTSLSPCGL